jgi:tetratricopeptide (TPR) repeat protein
MPVRPPGGSGCRGNEYLREKMPEKAIADYTEALKLFPGYRDACYNRGLAYYSIRDYRSAADDFSCAIGLKTDFWDAWLNRGIAFRALGLYRDALSDFNHVIAENPYGLAYYNRGVLYYFNLGEREKGCDDWNEAYRMGFVQAGEMLKKFCGAGAGDSR